jgi:predicted glycogen debranching enzyme
MRPHTGNVDDSVADPYPLTALGDRFEVGPIDGYPPLRIRVSGERRRFIMEVSRLERVGYTVEQSRGYDWQGTLYSVGSFRARIGPGCPVSLVASTERWDVALGMSGEDSWSAEQARRRRLVSRCVPAARSDFAAELALASDAFVIKPVGRHVDEARAWACGDDVRTVIAGYHWFTDWGRDTMISLEGLTLVTGRHDEAGFILRTFGHFIRDGLIPNMFPEGDNAGLYHTADATLWFFHAIDRYVRHTGDVATLDHLLPRLFDIIDRHQRGTRFGIVVDQADGLLRQGADGYQLTWMDAKVGDLVVTPRRGKAVEINALYFNALRLLEGWARERSDARADALGAAATRLQASFNRRFWYEGGGYLYDVVDGEGGDDASLRPNQLLAISLSHPVLDRARWEPVVTLVREKLWTPLGLRTLAPGSAAYKPQYFGNLYARDLAYHQGTVWAWLIGPFIDAWLRVTPDAPREAAGFLEGFEPELGRSCVGTIGEIFDAEAPYTARGCVAQAWSVAEVLRSLVQVGQALAKPSV